MFTATRAKEQGQRLLSKAKSSSPSRLYGGAALMVVGLALLLLWPRTGLEVVVALVAMGVALRIGAPALLLLVAIPVRFSIPGPFHSISFFELALPFALLHEARRSRSATVSGRWPVPRIVGVYVGWVLVSGIWSVDKLLWLRSVIFLAEVIAVGATFYLWTRRQGLTVTLRSWALVGLFATVAAIVWYYVLQRPEWMNLTPPRGSDETFSQLIRLGSPFWGPSNYFASMLLLFIPFALSSSLKTWLRIAIAGLGAIAIVGTVSRGAALAIVAVSLLVFIVVPLRRLPSLPIPGKWMLVALGGIVAVLLWVVLNRSDLRFDFFHDPNRISYYQDALRQLVQRPVLGSGYGSWPSLVQGSATKGVHNYYLQVAVETGLIGAALFVAAFLALIIRAAKLAGDLGFATTTALLLVAVNITVEASFEGEVFSWLFAMLVGMMLAWRARTETAITSDREQRDQSASATPASLEVCIVAYESDESVVRAVRSTQRLGSDVRVAIHDNSSAPLQFAKVRAVVSEMGISMRIERCGENCGFARACNSLARSSTAEVLLFLNPDAEILEWPEELNASAISRGIVGPVVVNDRNREVTTFGRKRSILEEFLQRWARWRPPMPKGEGYVSGAALLVPKDAFLRLGGFDEAFFMYYEDIDLCLRANRSGVPVSVEPSWIVRHTGGHAARRDGGTALIRSYESARYFYAKNGRSVAIYRALCQVDALLRLTLFSLLPSRRSSVPALRQLLGHMAATTALK
jgi:GT2 family glycosyltransferase/O-antigen ligase